MRHLKDLTVDEAAVLAERVGFKLLKQVFIDKGISGMMLFLCDDVRDLQADEYGVSNVKIATALMEMIVDWKEKGVPSF